MTALDAFSLTPAQWDELESRYEKVAHLPAEEMLVELIGNATPQEQKWLVLGIMVGRASVSAGK